MSEVGIRSVIDARQFQGKRPALRANKPKAALAKPDRVEIGE